MMAISASRQREDSRPAGWRPREHAGAASIVVAVLVLGMLATAIVGLGRRDQLHDEYEGRYRLARLGVVAELEAGVARYATVLRTTGGFIASSEDVTLDEFVRYGDLLDLESEYPAMASVAFVESVPWADREAFAATLASRVPGAQIETGDLPHELFVASLSTAGPERIGTEVGRDIVRLEALTRARDTGRPAMTGPIVRIADAALSPAQRPLAVALYAPVYDAVDVPSAVTDRRAHMRGWTASSFRLDDLADALGLGGALVDVELQVDGATAAESLRDRPQRRVEQLDLYGSTWSIVFAPTATLGAPSDEWKSVLWAGSSSTVGLAAVMALLATQRARLRRKVDAAVAETASINRRLERDSNFQRALLANLQVGVILIDDRGRLATYNLDSEGLFAGTLDAEYDGSWSELLGLYELDGTLLPEERNPMLRVLRGDRVRALEIVVRPQDGEEHVVSCNGQPIIGQDGEQAGAVVAIHDITELKHAQAKLESLARHDALTGLPNRADLVIRIADAFARAERHGTELALLFVDLDGFKGVNDHHGHDVGDELLVAVARRLRAACRTTDVAARLGGDEFVVLCDDLEPGAAVDEMVARIRRSIEQPFELPRVDEPVRVGASVGVAIGRVGDDPSELLRRADQAMYREKAGRRGGS
jgi:diguanylate cyclase (GGDEF)-like protein/PAS domain S-box-containing protein